MKTLLVENEIKGQTEFNRPTLRVKANVGLRFRVSPVDSPAHPGLCRNPRAGQRYRGRPRAGKSAALRHAPRHATSLSLVSRFRAFAL